MVYPHPAGQLPATDWLGAPSVRRSEIRVGGRGRRWRRWSGSGIRGRGGGGGCSGSLSAWGKFPLPGTDPEDVRPSAAAGRWKGAPAPGSRPSVPQAPETTRGRGRREGPTHPPISAEAPPGLPRGAGGGERQRAATTPAPSPSNTPGARTPTVPGSGASPSRAGREGPPPRRACPFRGGEKGREKGGAGESTRNLPARLPPPAPAPARLQHSCPNPES